MKSIDDNFWYNYLKVYDVLNDAHPYNDLLQEVIKNVFIDEKPKILDAGSGTGNHSIALTKLGAKVYSIDTSAVGLEMHLKKYSAANVLLHDLVEPLPFKDDYFDYIISLNTVCFIKKENREKVFDEFYRVLKPGGKIICANLLYYFKPFKVFLAHVQKDIIVNGFFKAFWGLIKVVSPMLKMFYYTNIIKKHGQKNDFFSLDEQYEYLVNANFNRITKSDLVFGKQSILNIASK